MLDTRQIPQWLAEPLIVFAFSAIGAFILSSTWKIGRMLFRRRAPSPHFEPLLQQIESVNEVLSSVDPSLKLPCGGVMVANPGKGKDPYVMLIGRVEDHLTRRELKAVHRAARKKLAHLRAIAREREGRELLAKLKAKT